VNLYQAALAALLRASTRRDVEAMLAGCQKELRRTVGIGTSHRDKGLPERDEATREGNRARPGIAPQVLRQESAPYHTACRAVPHARSGRALVLNNVDGRSFRPKDDGHNLLQSKLRERGLASELLSQVGHNRRDGNPLVEVPRV
jgi:hypothetical protein